ncbi:MAG: right-handed parallel beta-helix repeat-containing protein [Anaerolineae bacterium]|nr:right-handed parallel beta-helix repeat-containing protein [Anaerolineae bacterium]
MKRFTVNISVSLVLGLGLALVLLWLVGGGWARLSIPIALAADPARSTSAPGDVYCVTLGGGGPYPDCDQVFTSVQAAVDAASEGEIIKVAAGTYTGVQGRPPPAGYDDSSVITQVVYISKTVTVRGGYTTAFADPPDPETNETTLDAQGQGRVLFIGGYITPTIEGLRITGGDSAGLEGGGVYAINASVTLSGCQIIANTANQFSSPYGGSGGGIYLINSHNATLRGNTIRDNTAWFGGGVYLYASDNATLAGNTILNNQGNGWYGAAGGGVLLHDSADAMLTGNIIQGNMTQVGGGVYLYASDNATLKGNTILSNTAGGSHTFLEGGGVSVWDSDGVTLTGNVIRANMSDDVGGICLVGSQHIVLDNNIITDNQSWWNGSVLVADSTVHLRHTTLARNVGGGLSVAGSDSVVVMTNTIMVSHTTGISVASGSTVTLEATLWGAGSWANAVDYGGPGTIVTGTLAHNLWGDPAFVNPDAGDYHIGTSSAGTASAAINTGVDAGVLEDIDGEPRSDGYPDIGADEVQSALSVTKRAYPSMVEAGERLTYTIRITNTGNTDLHAVITDTLPLSVTLGETFSGTMYLPRGTIMLPDGRTGITWTVFIPAPGGVWTGTVVVTTTIGYAGPLTNVVNVTTEEGAIGMDIEVTTVKMQRFVYLPLVLRNFER